MCLTLREEWDEPYNKSKFRWKVVISRIYSSRCQPVYYGPYTGKLYSKPGVWMKATYNTSYIKQPHDIGFHVFVTKKSALTMRRIIGGSSKVVKVEVDGFNASGKYGIENSETWKNMRIVAD